jgi:hypothetical protein
VKVWEAVEECTALVRTFGLSPAPECDQVRGAWVLAFARRWVGRAGQGDGPAVVKVTLPELVALGSCWYGRQGRDVVQVL